MNKIDNKVIVITGGGQGLGAAICRTLAKEKAIVVPIDIQTDKLDSIVEEVRANGGLVDGFVMDITNPQNVEAIVQDIIDTHGTIDALINQDAGHEVRSACRLALATLSGERVLPDQERIRLDIFLRDNMP